MADLIIAAVVLVLVLYGVRRGLFRTVVSLLGAAVGVWCIQQFHKEAGALVTAHTRFSPLVIYGLAAVVCFAAGYLATVTIGRLLIARLKRPGRTDSDLSGAARSAFASFVGLVDGLLGGVLGLVFGALLVSGVLFAARHFEVAAVSAALRESRTMQAFDEVVLPELLALPEVRALGSFDEVERIAAVLEAHPERVDRVVSSPRLQPFFDAAPVRRLSQDDKIQALLSSRLYSKLPRHPHVLVLLKDREVVRVFANIDIRKVLAEVEDKASPAWQRPRILPSPAGFEVARPRPGPDHGGPVAAPR